MTDQAPQPARGYVFTYRPGERLHCPGCGGLTWHVGRFSAECGACGTVLDLDGASRQMMGREPRK